MSKSLISLNIFVQISPHLSKYFCPNLSEYFCPNLSNYFRLGCDKVTQLQPSPDIDGLAWKCPRSKDKCTVSPSLLREHSIFQFSKDKLLWILKIILCWRENTSLSQCHQVTIFSFFLQLSLLSLFLGNWSKHWSDFLLVWKMSTVLWICCWWWGGSFSVIQSRPFYSLQKSLIKYKYQCPICQFRILINILQQRVGI